MKTELTGSVFALEFLLALEKMTEMVYNSGVKGEFSDGV